MTNEVKGGEDTHQLITEDVYRPTVSVSQSSLTEREFGPEILNKRAFQNHGIMTVIGSIIVVTLIILTFLFIQINYTSSTFPETTRILRLSLGETSTIKTLYVLPEDVPLVEISSNDFDPSKACPDHDFALVIHLESEKGMDGVEPWLKKCGENVRFFRMNGEFITKEIVYKSTAHVPKAMYIPVRAEYNGIKDSPNILNDPMLQADIDAERDVITSLRLSGYVTTEDLETLVDLIPYVEEVIMDGAELCTSLYRKPRVSQKKCKVSLSLLNSLKITTGNTCGRTFDFIDTCWEMPLLRVLEIKKTHITEQNVQYIEHIIDYYRLTQVKFQRNLCTDEVASSKSYMCW